MNKNKGLSLQGREILKALDIALRDGKTIRIDIDGEKGTVVFWVGRDKVGRYRDAYEAMADLLPEGYLEAAE